MAILTAKEATTVLKLYEVTQCGFEWYSSEKKEGVPIRHSMTGVVCSEHHDAMSLSVYDKESRRIATMKNSGDDKVTWTVL